MNTELQPSPTRRSFLFAGFLSLLGALFAFTKPTRAQESNKSNISSKKNLNCSQHFVHESGQDYLITVFYSAGGSGREVYWQSKEKI